ncbi:MAG: alpha-glucosidase [Chloroflexota bacterium]
MDRTWWKESVVYQIYPRSFMDSNGDGIGDLPGIIAKLDYLKLLGVGVVWLCPVYRSPNDDNGYDISDYQDIMPEFGTLADWERLRDGLHERGMKLIMDLVVNHTSDEHPWFIQSRQSKDNPYRDYYIWRPGRGGGEPNNWVSFFSGSAWQYDPLTDEYYLHLFSRKQPDLNWENPAVRQSVYDMMRWWLDKGVDGFRMDVINLISKVPGLPDAPITGPGRYQWAGPYFANGPRIHELLQEMNTAVLSNYDVMTVGEMPMVSPEQALLYVAPERREVNMIFQFDHTDLDSGPGGKWDVKPWKLTDLKRVLSRWQVELHGRGWNSLYLNNHDQPRQVSRFGNGTTYRVESAKLLATLLHTLPGTPYIYQGEEIGMTNVAFDSIEEYRDVETLNMYRERVVASGADPQAVLAAIHAKGRDNARTPMQWDDTPQAGFTTGVPWIGVNPNYGRINVAQALADPHSIFHYYRRLIQLRRQLPIIVYGDYQLLLPDDEQLYAYLRRLGNERLLIVLNFSDQEVMCSLPAAGVGGHWQLVIGNYEVEDRPEQLAELQLKPYEARVYQVVPDAAV